MDLLNLQNQQSNETSNASPSPAKIRQRNIYPANQSIMTLDDE